VFTRSRLGFPAKDDVWPTRVRTLQGHGVVCRPARPRARATRAAPAPTQPNLRAGKVGSESSRRRRIRYRAAGNCSSAICLRRHRSPERPDSGAELTPAGQFPVLRLRRGALRPGVNANSRTEHGGFWAREVRLWATTAADLHRPGANTACSLKPEA